MSSAAGLIGLHGYRLLTLLFSVLVLVGCGGGAGTDATAGASDQPPVVSADTSDPAAPVTLEPSDAPPAVTAEPGDAPPAVTADPSEAPPAASVGTGDQAPVITADPSEPPPAPSVSPSEPPPPPSVDESDAPSVAVAEPTAPPSPAIAEQPPITGRGELKGAELLGTIEAYEIAAALAAGGSDAPPVVPLYSVRSYRLTYVTLDGRDREVVASGLVSVPLKGGGARAPVLSYQHGTIFFDAEAPSNNVVASEPPQIIASLGYIVVAADYVGYGASKGTPHPYLAAAPTAAAVLDLLTAAQTWRRSAGVGDNGQLFLAGYSEGGYATMAAHRALQAGANAVAAQVLGSTPGAGPYHVGVTLDALLDRVRDDNPLLGNLLSPGLLRYLGSSVRREVRKQLVDALVPDDADVEFQTDFIDYYLADDDAALERCCNVHDWNPQQPVRMYHGRDDTTVPYAASARTLQTMLLRGSSAASLTDCSALPSSHLACVPPYFAFVLGAMAGEARDL